MENAARLRENLIRMGASIEDSWSMSEKALVAAYADARRNYAIGAIARDYSFLIQEDGVKRRLARID